MVYTKRGPFIDNSPTGPYIDAGFFNAVEAALTAAAYDAGVYPEAFVQPTDAGNWALAIGRALAYATPLGLPVILQALYPITSTVTLNSGDHLVGRGPATGLQCPVNAPVTILQATNMTGIVLDNFTVDGNCLTLSTKNFTRGVRFISCTSIRVHRLTARYIADWATSFEKCANVLVTDYVYRVGAASPSGGRDGIHFIDCNDVLLDGARIHSGDDCVGITSETQAINRITVRNVTGMSNIAAVVTVGNEGSTAFTASDITVENVSTYTSPDSGGISAYVVKMRAQNTSILQRVRISNVTGIATSHGVWLQGSVTNRIAEVEILGVNTVSTTNHGVLLDAIAHFEARSIRGTSTAGGFDGINISNSQYGTLAGSARNCSLWGLQLNACTSVDVVGFVARDNGGNNFASSAGGNGRIVNCTDVYVNGGQFVGSITTSYNGLSLAGNTTTVVSTNTRIGGAH